MFRLMSRVMPECEEEMRSIPHITEANYLKYGAQLLEITQRFAANKLVLLSDRADAAELSTAEESSIDVAGSWLASVSAPEPAHDSPYFGQVRGRGGRGGFRGGRRFTRGRKRGSQRAKSSTATVSTTGESYQVIELW